MEAKICTMLTVKTFLHFIVVVILQINTIKQDIVFKEFERLHKTQVAVQLPSILFLHGDI